MPEHYNFLGNTFDIDKAIEIAADKEVELITVEQVQQIAPQLIFHYKDPEGNIIEDIKPGMKYSMSLGTSVEDKKWALEHADLEKPVIWFSSPNLSILIDGYHRLYRAWKQKKPLKCRVIKTKEEAKEIIVDWISLENPVNRWFKKEEVTCHAGN